MSDQQAEDFRAAISAFAARRVAEVADAAEATERFPRELVAEIGAIGLFAARFPADLGGHGGRMIDAVVGLEEIAFVSPGIASSLLVHLAVCGLLAQAATPAQRSAYLTPALRGTALTGMAITEPDAGSDVRSMRTRARRRDDGWVLDGQKLYITNGAVADFVVVAAKTDDDAIRWFLTETDRPGYQVLSSLHKLGVRSSDTAELRFEGLHLPPTALLGDPATDGLALAHEAFNQDRILGAAVAVGTARRALSEAVSFVNQREQFHRPVAEFQAVRHQIADLATEVAATRALLYQAAEAVQLGRPYEVEAAMVKLKAGQLVRHVTVEALELHGGQGFMTDTVVSALYRHAPVMGIAGGTANMQRELIGRRVLRGAWQ